MPTDPNPAVAPPIKDLATQLTRAELLEALEKTGGTDPLIPIRNFRDQIRDEMARLRAAEIVLNHDDLHNISQQIEAILCPPSPEHEAAVHTARERHARAEQEQVNLLKAELKAKVASTAVPPGKFKGD